MREVDFLHHNVCIPNFLDSLIHKIKFSNPDELAVNGLIAFCGVQGSGKTLSATLYLKKLMDYYPKLICVSNISLNYNFFDSSRIIPYTGISQMHDISNGVYGVVFFLDEIQLEFNSLESKQMTTPIFELVCQQRKQRKHIIGTTQVFARLAKPFREQFKYAILCEHLIGSFFSQHVHSAINVSYEDDIRTELKPLFKKYYFACPSDFSMYDTYEVINRIGGVLK